MKSPGITPHAGSASVWHSLVATHCDRLTELPDHSTIAHQSLPIIARNPANARVGNSGASYGS